MFWCSTEPRRPASRLPSTIPLPASSRSLAPRHWPLIRRHYSRSRSPTPAPILRPKPASSTWSSTMERSQATWRMRSSRSPRSTTSHPPSISTATIRRSPERATARRSPKTGHRFAIADTDTLIGDPDIGGAIASATITLTNPQTGDLLTATLPLPGGITASAYDPVTGTLTLSNVASFADYETALEAIRFSAAGDNPVAGTRIIQVVVNDGIHNSQPATSHITVVAANDAPALVVADATYQEGAAPVLLSPSASLTDADDTELTSAAVQITAGSFPGDGDILTVGGDHQRHVLASRSSGTPHCMRWSSPGRVRSRTTRRCCRRSNFNRRATIPPTSTRVRNGP